MDFLFGEEIFWESWILTENEKEITYHDVAP